MRYTMLGTTQAIRDDGSTVPVGGARLRALLTALALRPGRAVPAASLIEEVWDGDPPADGSAALQALVGRLRRALGREAVGSGEGGYWLVAERDDIDLYRFERLERLARAAAQASPEEAAALYDEALSLWRGEPLSSLPGSGPEAARWEALRLDARRGRLDAALALGEAERVLPELTALCAGLPLDESLQALRIRALRDAGRPAEALAAYDEVRRDLADRLGTTPGPALRALHTALLAPAPATPRTPGHTAPPAGRTDPGGAGAPAGTTTPGSAARTGSGAAGRAPGPDGRTAAPPAPPESATAGAGAGDPYAAGPGPAPVPTGPGAGNLRMRLTTFVGREEDIRVIGTDLGRSRLVTLLGPGGAGKTRLSQEAAEAHARTGRGTPGQFQGQGPGQGSLPGALPGTPEERFDDAPPAGSALTTSASGGSGMPGPTPHGSAPGGPGSAPHGSAPGGPGPAGGAATPAPAPAAGGGPVPDWADGVWFVELAPVDDPEDVPEAVLAALGARETKLRGGSAEEMRALTERGGDRPLDRLAEHCARRRMLLILDNCEHVVDAAARLAEEVLARCPGVQILATSREPLGVPGETLRPVDPLPDPVALRLLDDRGAAARAGFTVDEDPAAAVEICRRLDGMPLAIELAAARLRLLTPRQIADRLDDRFRLLTGGARTHLPRQQTLRAVVDWSWDLLDEPERVVLRRLSVFAGGCDLDAAEAVCADGGSSGRRGGADVADLLGSLVDKSLVVAAPDGPTGMRYRLLETVAEYAADRLGEAGGDRAETERRHLTHYRELARTTEPLLRGHGQRAAADRLATEYENLRTALRRAINAKDVNEVLCLVHSLVWYWHMHDLRAETRHWAGAAAALGPNPFAAPVVPAEAVYERIVDTPPPYEGELLTEAWRGIRMMVLASHDQTSETWSTPEARDEIDRMIAAYSPGLPQLCRAPSALWIYAVMIWGDPDLLRRVTEETVETARALGYRWELASALQLRANILANRADWAGNAARDAEESLALYVSLGDDWGCAEALSARGESYEKRGEYALAAQDFRAAIDYARRLGAEAQVAVLQVRMSGTLAEGGHLEEAEELLIGVLRGAVHQFGNEAMPAARMFLATVYGRTGRIPEARAQLQYLRDEFSFGAFAVFDGFLLGTMAWLDNEEGRSETALTVLRQALVAVRDPLAMMVAPQLPAAFLITGARALVQLGGPEREYDAARLIGAYRALLPPAHVPVAVERADVELVERLARAALGDAGYGAAYAEGGGLTLEEATALI
ncbi:BTAD domain-containing putative transcriptional regulator [Streptomyces sp. NPDC056773]|uniref:AfsR/SARP family transcriptional regulator n=1 Tax=unclassified Streptomyces TaxID=2593676 RepID=UPI00369AACF4